MFSASGWAIRRLAVASLAGAGFAALATSTAGASIEARSNTETIQPGGAGDSSATCPGGSTAISSGFGVGGFNTVSTGLVPTASRVNAPDDTDVFGVNRSNAKAGTLTGYAYCDTSAPEVVTRVAWRLLPVDSARTIRAGCPDGTRLISGGFVGSYDELVYPYRSKKVRNGWRVSAYNPPGGVARNVKALAFCEPRGRALRVGVASAVTDPSQAHGLATVEPTCPDATLPVAGGFDGHLVTSPPPSGVVPLESRRVAGGWRLTGWSLSTTSDAQLTGFVYCEPL